MSGKWRRVGAGERGQGGTLVGRSGLPNGPLRCAKICEEDGVAAGGRWQVGTCIGRNELPEKPGPQ